MRQTIPNGKDVYSGERCREISAAGYRQLAEFRYRIRQFLHLSEEAARSKGIEPQQHQLLLAVKGLPAGTRPNVRTLSQRLCLRHHSTVELIDRLVEHGAVTRRHSDEDRREVLIELTPRGEELLHQLSVRLWQELKVSGPALFESLSAVLAHSVGRGRNKHEPNRPR
jgi:DNA-binding MarR family transcriptional regulator